MHFLFCLTLCICVCVLYRVPTAGSGGPRPDDSLAHGHRESRLTLKAMQQLRRQKAKPLHTRR